ncbi:MAG: hypothetical protein H0W45_04270 [Acidobacteria bacterium]|nr:hypothetical protein [Acidobacteriota bacterium]
MLGHYKFSFFRATLAEVLHQLNAAPLKKPNPAKTPPPMAKGKLHIFYKFSIKPETFS